MRKEGKKKDINDFLKPIPKKSKYSITFDRLWTDYPNTEGSKDQTFKNYKECRKKYTLTEDEIYKASMNSAQRQRDKNPGIYDQYIYRLSNVLGQKYSDQLCDLLIYDRLKFLEQSDIIGDILGS